MRCYNGAPDSALTAVIEERTAAHKRLAELGVRATWFPMEERWMGFDDQRNEVTKSHSTVFGVLAEVEE